MTEAWLLVLTGLACGVAGYVLGDLVGWLRGSRRGGLGEAQSPRRCYACGWPVAFGEGQEVARCPCCGRIGVRHGAHPEPGGTRGEGR